MSVKCILDYAGVQQSFEVNGSTIGGCLDDLIRQFPDLKAAIFDEDGTPASMISFYINGKDAGRGLNSPVKDGDEFSIKRPGE